MQRDMQQAVLQARLAIVASINGKLGMPKSARGRKRLLGEIDEIGCLAERYKCKSASDQVRKMHSILNGDADE